MKGGSASETEVTWEDQQNINKFGRLNNRLHELEDEIKIAKVFLIFRVFYIFVFCFWSLSSLVVSVSRVVFSVVYDGFCPQCFDVLRKAPDRKRGGIVVVSAQAALAAVLVTMVGREKTGIFILSNQNQGVCQID